MNAREIGEYRTIYVVIEDSPQFQALTTSAQRVLYSLKLRLPPSGINVLYAAELTPRCGRDMTVARTEDALAELEGADWIMRDGPIIWLVNGLRYEINLSWQQWNHRRGIQRRIFSLPSSAIVESFKSYYPLWMIPADKMTGALADKRIKDLVASRVSVDEIVAAFAGRIRATSNGQARPAIEGPPEGPEKAPPKALPRGDVIDTGNGDASLPREPSSSTRTPASAPDPLAEAGDEIPERVARALGSLVARDLPEIDALPQAEQEWPLRALWRVSRSPGATRTDVAAYVGEMRAVLDGMHGTALAPLELVRACRDWSVNKPELGLGLFRVYLARVARDTKRERGPRSSTPARSATRLSASRLRGDAEPVPDVPRETFHAGEEPTQQ